MRHGDLEDVSELADLEHDVFDSEARSGSWTEESVRGLLDEGTLVLVESAGEGRLLAYASFRSVLDESELLRVAVRPEARRRGLARRLVVYGLEELKAQGVGTCHLEVRADNSAARSLYRDLGFERVGRRRGYYRDGCDAELWQLILTDAENA